MSPRVLQHKPAQRPTLEQLPDPMRPADVAALLGISKDLVYKEILAGRLRVKRLGGDKRPTYLVTHAWYRDWLMGGSGPREEVERVS